MFWKGFGKISWFWCVIVKTWVATLRKLTPKTAETFGCQFPQSDNRCACAPKQISVHSWFFRFPGLFLNPEEPLKEWNDAPQGSSKWLHERSSVCGFKKSAFDNKTGDRFRNCFLFSLFFRFSGGFLHPEELPKDWNDAPPGSSKWSHERSSVCGFERNALENKTGDRFCNFFLFSWFFRFPELFLSPEELVKDWSDAP